MMVKPRCKTLKKAFLRRISSELRSILTKGIHSQKKVSQIKELFVDHILSLT